MSDPRLTPPAHFGQGDAQSITAPVTDLRHTTNGPRDRQLLLGAAVTLFETRDGFGYVQSHVDGYCGFVATGALGAKVSPTHFVSTYGTHAYTDENFKSHEVLALPFGAKVTVTAERPKFYETPVGYIPKKHLRPLDRPFSDPATVAQLHFGTPYLWGGNSTRGIDCSGLIQAALHACNMLCPGDSDMQQSGLGRELAADVTPIRGDIFFWKGHVGMMVDSETLLHANAHHMATAYEPLANAIIRIKAQGDGDVLRRARL